MSNLSSQSDNLIQTRPSARVLHSTAIPETSRGDVVWAWKWLILLIALLGAAAAAFFGTQQPVVYTAQATVRVSLLQSPNIGAQNALASNELAAQYAQIADADPIIRAAASSAGATSDVLRANVSASPINKYNVVGITASASNSSGAAKRADAVARSLVNYLNASYAKSVQTASKSSAAQLKSLDVAIAQARRDVQRRVASATASDTAVSSARSLLSSLIALRQNLYLAPINELSQARPTLTVLNAPSEGTAKSQHLWIYAVAGFLAAGAIAAELCVLTAHFRWRRRR